MDGTTAAAHKQHADFMHIPRCNVFVSHRKFHRMLSHFTAAFCIGKAVLHDQHKQKVSEASICLLSTAAKYRQFKPWNLAEQKVKLRH
jgi:hypothetical protein